MGNKKEKSLPDLPPDIQARLDALSRQARAIWASMDYELSKKAVRIGHKLLLGEEAVYEIFGQKRDVWGQFRSHYFPEIETSRMTERYMLLARHIDLDDPPILFCLSQASLTYLISRAGRHSLIEFLAAKEIKIDWEINPLKRKNKPQVARFKKAVLDLIASLKNAEANATADQDQAKKPSMQPDAAKTEIVKEPIENLDELFDQVEQLLTSITTSKDFEGRERTRVRVKVKKYRRILTAFLEATSRKHQDSVELSSSRARSRGGKPIFLKKRPSRLCDN
jgi:hypothetical protein